MIYQIECDCGSSAIGELHEKNIIDQWAAEHRPLCDGKFITQMKPLHKQVCPVCQITYYGESEEETLNDLSNHYATRTDCSSGLGGV